MYAVKGIDVSTRIRDVVEHKVSVYISLFNKYDFKVLEQIVEPVRWSLNLFSREGSVESLTTGNTVKIRSPFLRGRSCLGDNIVSIVKNVQENTVYIHRTAYLCNRFADDSFCPLHIGSEYSKYLLFVYGLKEFPQGVGLALIPHMVYLLYIGGSNLKVGIANAVKNIVRLYEQVFIYSSIVAFVENAAIARGIEKKLSSYYVKDRASVVERLEWIKRVDVKMIEEHLKNFVMMFSRHVKPLLKSVGIEKEKEFIPVIRFYDKCFEVVEKSYVMYDRDSLNVLEGVAEVEDYCLGGFTVNLGGKRYFIPYQLIRDHFIAIDIVK
jgi:hypothetical protein